MNEKPDINIDEDDLIFEDTDIDPNTVEDVYPIKEPMLDDFLVIMIKYSPNPSIRNKFFQTYFQNFNDSMLSSKYQYNPFNQRMREIHVMVHNRFDDIRNKWNKASA